MDIAICLLTTALVGFMSKHCGYNWLFPLIQGILHFASIYYRLDLFQVLVGIYIARTYIYARFYDSIRKYVYNPSEQHEMFVNNSFKLTHHISVVVLLTYFWVNDVNPVYYDYFTFSSIPALMAMVFPKLSKYIVVSIVFLNSIIILIFYYGLSNSTFIFLFYILNLCMLYKNLT